MTFDGGRNSESTKGIYFAYAPNPWGPWSKPQLIFNACRDNGLGNFMFYYYPSPAKNTCPSLANASGPSGPTIGSTNDPTTTRGTPYGPAIVGRFTIVSGTTLKLFYLMSTWNPYATVLMESDFNIASGPPISSYFCTNATPPSITSIDSASGYGAYPYFASGSWLEIKGTNLADSNDPRLCSATNPGQWSAADFNRANAPTLLDGIGIAINGKPAYVAYLSPSQINVQAPEDSFAGRVTVTVTNCTATSPAFSFSRRALAPGMLAPPNYSANGTQYMVATFASDGAYVLNSATGALFGLTSRPAKPGDLIIAYGIGFGDVTPSVLPGVQVEQSNSLNNPVAISFGSTKAALTYSGLAGNFVGLYEFYITVPPGLADGEYQIHVTQNGTAVPQTMYLTVQN